MQDRAAKSLLTHGDDLTALFPSGVSIANLHALGLRRILCRDSDDAATFRRDQDALLNRLVGRGNNLDALGFFANQHLLRDGLVGRGNNVHALGRLRGDNPLLHGLELRRLGNAGVALARFRIRRHKRVGADGGGVALAGGELRLQFGVLGVGGVKLRLKVAALHVLRTGAESQRRRADQKQFLHGFPSPVEG